MIIERDIYQEIKPYLRTPEAIVITGMRRTGKTTILRFLADQISTSNKLIMDLENPLNRKFFDADDYDQIKDSLSLKGLDFTQPAYIFLDEIQLVPQLPSVVKYLMDHYHVKFFLTGSSSFYLKNLFSESLAGRKYIFELFPLNFQEFLRLKEERLAIPAQGKSISRVIYQVLGRLYDEYLRFGGFPGVVIKSSLAEKRRALDDIFSAYFQMEVVQIGDYRKTGVVRDLMQLLAQRIGSKLDITKIATELHVSRPTIYEYLSFLEATYFIKLVRPYSQSQDVAIRSAAKPYLCDSGLVNVVGDVDDGALFENNVFQQLRPRGEIHYYQKRGGAEVDFILNRERAYEVKLTPTPPDLKRLRRVGKEIGLKKYSLVAKNYSELPGVCYGFNL